MIDYIKAIRSLLPSGKAFNTYGDKVNAKFFKGLFSWVPAQLDFVRQGILNFFPQTTQDLDKFEDQFGLIAGDKTEQERRDQLAAAWRGVVGGQDIAYLNSVLSQAGFDLFVHEWFDLLDSGFPPDVRNPFDYINIEDNVISCGMEEAQCGAEEAQCGYLVTKDGYLLVNNIFFTTKSFLAICGDSNTQCNNETSACGEYSGLSNIKVPYTINPNRATFPFYLYVCGENFPDVVEIPLNQRDRLETLLLKHMPAKYWIGVLVKYI